MCVIQVTSPFGQYYHYSVDTEHGSFAFTASEEGDYTICFRAADHTPPYTVSVEFEWKSGYATIDWSKIAKRRQIQVINQSIIHYICICILTLINLVTHFYL